MNSNDFKKMDILDILFQGKNKEYGAYELRKNYKRRLILALLIGAVGGAVLMTAPAVAGMMGKKKKAVIKVTKVKKLDAPKPINKKKPPKPPPPPPPPPAPPKLKFTPPVIKKDEEVKEPPPKQEDLKLKPPGDKDNKGTPGGQGTGAPAAPNSPPPPPPPPPPPTPPPAPKPTGPTRKVDIDADYPGGMGALTSFLQDNLTYPDQEAEDGVTGKAVVEFVVDLDGSCTGFNITQSTGNKNLDAEALRVAKLAGKKKWTPARFNGEPVQAFRTLPVTFSLEE
ncbi:MAG: hypothetical protein RL660_1187 [Bacteroidota bacterium]|jgi:protein TonB